MAYIHIPKAWKKIAAKASEENVYFNRREILKKMGWISAGLMSLPLVHACEGVGPDNKEFTFERMDEFYPSMRSSLYPIDRPLTDEHAATHHNNFYEFISPDDSNIYNVHKYVADFDNRDWHIEVSGLVGRPGTYFLGDLIREMGLEERTYRHRCVEAWAMAVPWTGFQLSKLIDFLQPDNKATHIRMISYSDKKEMIGVETQDWYPWPYFEGLRMEEAMNELAFVATGLYGKPMPKQNGAPVRLVIPWKYGYKSIKSIVKIEFIDSEPETFWHQVVPEQYGFLSNVDPAIPHPNWSQAREVMLGSGAVRNTQKFNGYGDFVAHLY